MSHRGHAWGPLPLQLLFATAAHGVLTLDFVLERDLVLPDGTSADAGQPFSMTFELGEESGSVSPLCLLTRWCDSGDQVFASSKVVAEHPSLILVCEETVVDLQCW